MLLVCSHVLKIYKTQVSELGTKSESLTAELTAKEGLLQETHATINSKVQQPLGRCIDHSKDLTWTRLWGDRL